MDAAEAAECSGTLSSGAAEPDCATQLGASGALSIKAAEPACEIRSGRKRSATEVQGRSASSRSAAEIGHEIRLVEGRIQERDAKTGGTTKGTMTIHYNIKRLSYWCRCDALLVFPALCARLSIDAPFPAVPEVVGF